MTQTMRHTRTMKKLAAAVLAAGLIATIPTAAHASHRHVAQRDTAPFLDTDAHGVLLGTNMPACNDGLGRPCVVYITQDGMPGNSYWVDTAGDKHSFWGTDQVAGHRPPNHWLDEYGDSLIAGLQTSYPGQAGRNWHRCWFTLTPGQPSSANCPDGSTWLM